MSGEAARAVQSADAAIAAAERDGWPLFVGWAGIFRGEALAALGQTEQGLAQIREGLATVSATGTEIFRPYNLAQLAKVCAIAGHIGEGLSAVAQALDLIERGGEGWWEAEAHRISGELLLKQSRSDLAEVRACFERAIRIARKRGARSLELRATTSLARLLKDTSSRDEGRAMLAEIYNWFTEGLETADLKDARALLDELGA
jgi:predicted ATPase